MLHTVHSPHYDRPLTCKVLYAGCSPSLKMSMSARRGSLQQVFPELQQVRMVSGGASPTSLQESGMVTPPKILQPLRFPGFAVFSTGACNTSGGYITWIHNVHEVILLLLLTSCMYVRPKPHGDTHTRYADCSISPCHTCNLQNLPHYTVVCYWWSYPHITTVGF